MQKLLLCAKGTFMALCLIQMHRNEFLGILTNLENGKIREFFLKGSPYSITERRVPELVTVLGSQPAGDVSHKPGGRLPLLSARPAVTLTTLKRPATNFAAWKTEARWM